MLAIVLVSWGARPGARIPENPLPDPPTEVEDASESLADLVPGFEGTIALAVSSPTGRTSDVITWAHDDGDPVVRSIEPMTGIEFDAGGTWMAGFSLAGRPRGSTSRLFLGRTGARLQPLAEDIRRFSWHETAPAEMAYTTELASGPEIHVVDLRLGGTTRIPIPEDIGLDLATWGDWGFAVVRPDPIDRTAVLDRDGDLLLADVPGVPLGGVGANGIGFVPPSGPGSGGDEGPWVHDSRAFVLDGSSGNVTFPSWVRAGEHPWAVEPAPEGDAIALYVSRTSLSNSDVFLRISGLAGGPFAIADAGGPLESSWDPTGRWLVATVRRGFQTEVVVVDSRDLTVVTLPSLVKPGHLVHDISVIG